MFHRQWVQCVENVVRSHLRSHRSAQRLKGVLTQSRQHFVSAPIAELVVNEESVVQTCLGGVGHSLMIELS